MRIRMNLLTGVCTFMSNSVSVEKILSVSTMLTISYNLYRKHWFKDISVNGDRVIQIDMWV